MSHPVVTAWLNAAQARADAATPGPWVAQERGRIEASPTGGQDDWPDDDDKQHGPIITTPWDAGPTPADATFMAAARTDVPRLIAAVSAVLDVTHDLAVTGDPRCLLAATHLHDAIRVALTTPEEP